MASPWFAKKRIIVLILLIFVVLYVFLPAARPPTPSDLIHPPYALISPGDLVGVETPALSSSPTGRVKTVFPSQPVFLPSFFVASPIIKDLLSSDAHYARLLSKHVEQQTPTSKSVTPFACVCGRVSDACVCCGPLAIPRTVCQNRFPSGLCGPLVMFSTVESYAAHFCLNVTYHPKKQQVNTAGFLIPEAILPAGSQMIVSPRPSIPSNQTLVLFDNQILPVIDPPVFCVENSRTDPEMSICIQLSDLRYFYDTGSDHKTVFAGCGQVNVLLRRQFILTHNTPFCFRAHRGAAGDVDQASALAQEKKKDKMTISKQLSINKTGTESPSDFAHKSKIPSRLLSHISTTPPQKREGKDIAGSLDSHDALPVVP